MRSGTGCALFRYKPGVLFEDVRRPGYTETFGATHHVGVLEYKTLRATPSDRACLPEARTTRRS